MTAIGDLIAQQSEREKIGLRKHYDTSSQNENAKIQNRDVDALYQGSNSL